MKWAIVVAGGLVGCTPTTPTPSDAPHGSALRVEWTSEPATLPATVGSNVTITSAQFSLANLRLVGDAAPGDPRTRVDLAVLSWSSGKSPPANVFPDAPVGKYARVVFDLGGEDNSGDSEGTVVIAGTVDISGSGARPFQIADDGDLTIAVDIDAELTSAADVAIGIRVDLQALVGAVDFTALPEVDGVRVLDPGDPQTAKLEAKLVTAFSSQ